MIVKSSICRVRSPLSPGRARKAMNPLLSLDAKLEWIPREENEEADELARQAYERASKS